MKLKLRDNKGITLVALVVTIVVLLILAGISLNLVLGENGIIAKAKDAKEKTEQDAENTTTSLDNLYAEMLEEIESEPQKDDWYTVTDTIDLTGITEYHITNCKELKMFANTVNAGNNFEGITVYLDKNLDLQGNESKQWTPIGGSDSNTFNGTFDGKNHYIGGIYIDTVEDGYYGLFGFVGNCNDTNVIKNLGIKNSIIKAENNVNGGCIGGIAGYNCSIITNCYNEAKIIGPLTAGGIAGFNDYKILECYNIGDISGRNAGGICGDQEAELKYCYNNGTVTGTLVASGVSDVSEVEDCYNTGIIQGNENCETVGICASAVSINSYNIGEITGTDGHVDELSLCNSENSYFLSETSEDERARTSAFMKTQEFVDLLNAGREEAIWKMDTENINNGYPILFWQ